MRPSCTLRNRRGHSCSAERKVVGKGRAGKTKRPISPYDNRQVEVSEKWQDSRQPNWKMPPVCCYLQYTKSKHAVWRLCNLFLGEKSLYFGAVYFTLRHSSHINAVFLLTNMTQCWEPHPTQSETKTMKMVVFSEEALRLKQKLSSRNVKINTDKKYKILYYK